MTDDILARGRVAVITGAAKGIGAALAQALSALGMRLCLFDRDHDALATLAAALGRGEDVTTVAGDVAVDADLQALCDCAYDRFGEVALLVNNAGVIAGAGPWSDVAAWRHQLAVNLMSIVVAQEIFVPRMMAQQGRAAIVNLGSKEGITTPPGNAAYSVAKAGVKVLTEQLAHELLSAVGNKMTAHLLVPGYTWTPMNAALKPAGTPQPDEAWSTEKLVAYFLQRFRAGDFYIICPDGAVSSWTDCLRIRWAMDDMIANRPALSRWHPEWKARFEDFMRTPEPDSSEHDKR